MDVFVAEHVLNDAQIGVPPKFSREGMASAVHVHPALNFGFDETGSLEVLVPPTVKRLAWHSFLWATLLDLPALPPLGVQEVASAPEPQPTSRTRIPAHTPAASATFGASPVA